jgi:hypothetical protein
MSLAQRRRLRGRLGFALPDGGLPGLQTAEVTTAAGAPSFAYFAKGGYVDGTHNGRCRTDKTRAGSIAADPSASSELALSLPKGQALAKNATMGHPPWEWCNAKMGHPRLGFSLHRRCKLYRIVTKLRSAANLNTRIIRAGKLHSSF